MKYPKPFKEQGSRYYSFWFRDPAGGRRIVSTRCERAGDAHDFVRDYVDTRSSSSGNASFREYQARYYTDHCPHVARIRDDGYHVGMEHITRCRQWLDKWIVPAELPAPVGDGENLEAARRIHAFASKPLNRITRGDLLELRTDVKIRVREESSKHISGDGIATVNHTMSAVWTIFNEAHLRDHIAKNPAFKLRPIVYKQEERDIIEVREHHQLFDTMWTRRNHKGEDIADELSHDVFEFAALTGMRCGEILAMVPREQLDGRVLSIDRAWKGAEGVGKPKHEKPRDIVLCKRALEIARRYPGGFRLADGSMLGHTWWRRRFALGIAQRELVIGQRNIVPHSLRHSLNTHLLEFGVDPMLVQLYLWGKRSDGEEQGTTHKITRIQARYLHFESHATEAVATAIDEIYGKVEASEQEKQA